MRNALTDVKQKIFDLINLFWLVSGVTWETGHWAGSGNRWKSGIRSYVEMRVLMRRTAYFQAKMVKIIRVWDDRGVFHWTLRLLMQLHFKPLRPQKGSSIHHGLRQKWPGYLNSPMCCAVSKTNICSVISFQIRIVGILRFAVEFWTAEVFTRCLLQKW